MAEIKTREKFKGIKALDKAAVAGERMKRAFVRSKDQAENLLDDGQISPSEYAEDKVRCMAEDTAREVGHEAGKLTGKAQSVYRTRRETQRTVDAAQQDRTRIRYARSRTIKTAEIRQRTVKQTAKSTGQATVKTAKGTVKTAQKSAKTAQQTSKAAIMTAEATAKATKAAAQTSAKAARTTAQAAKTAAKTLAAAAKAAAKAIASVAKAIAAAVKALVAAIAAGGWVALIVIVIICLIAAVVAWLRHLLLQRGHRQRQAHAGGGAGDQSGVSDTAGRHQGLRDLRHAGDVRLPGRLAGGAVGLCGEGYL